MPAVVTNELQEADWKRLLRRIQSGKCTPLLGAGACYGALPLGADVAEYLAQRYDYPFPDRDLVRVAQYAAIQSDPNAPKEDVVEILRGAGPPKYSQPPQFSGRTTLFWKLHMQTFDRICNVDVSCRM